MGASDIFVVSGWFWQTVLSVPNHTVFWELYFLFFVTFLRRVAKVSELLNLAID